MCNAVGVCRDTLYRGKYEFETDANDALPMDVLELLEVEELLRWRNT